MLASFLTVSTRVWDRTWLGGLDSVSVAAEETLTWSLWSGSFSWAGSGAFVCVSAQLLGSCPTLCDPTDCSPPGSSAHGILRASLLERVAVPSSRGPSRPGDWRVPLVSPALAAGVLSTSAAWEAARFCLMRIILTHVCHECARCNRRLSYL